MHDDTDPDRTERTIDRSRCTIDRGEHGEHRNDRSERATDRSESTADRSERSAVDRRTALAGLAALGTGGLAGCLSPFDDGDESDPFNWIGSGPGRRPASDGTPMAELPDLEGEITVYSGRGRFLVDTLIQDLNEHYDDFQAQPRYGGSSEMANQIQTEGEGTNADVFFSATGAPLARLAADGRTRDLSEDTLGMVPAEFQTENWVGTGGRIRSLPYNTNALSSDEVPDDVLAVPDLDADLGWAPSYEACQEFVTALRVLEDDETARQWVSDLVDAGVQSYGNEQLVCEAIADGEIDLGLTNHYYVQRVQASRDDPPLATAFTAGDAGATFNVAGAAVIDETDAAETAENFVRHLLSAEAQIYFAERTYEYPLASDVEPTGDLPGIDELNVPDLDLRELADAEGTVELMRDAGVDI